MVARVVAVNRDAIWQHDDGEAAEGESATGKSVDPVDLRVLTLRDVPQVPALRIFLLQQIGQRVLLDEEQRAALLRGTDRVREIDEVVERHVGVLRLARSGRATELRCENARGAEHAGER